MKMKILVAGLLLLAHLLATTASAGSRIIREADFGEDWPFLVSGGELHCRGPKAGLGRVTFTANDVTYAVNGLASSHGYAEIEPIWKPDWPMIEQWAEASDMTPEQFIESEGYTLRISITPIIKAGLALCGE